MHQNYLPIVSSFWD